MTDALHAGGKSEANVTSVMSQLLMLSCVCYCKCISFPEEGGCFIKDLQSCFQTGFLRDRLESLSHAGFCPPASCEAQQHLAAPLPASLQEQLPPSCCELCNSGVYNEGTLPVETQTRTYNLGRVRMEAGRESVPAVLQ